MPILATTAFDNGWMPAILGELQLPTLRVVGHVRFLIDTGSEGILINQHGNYVPIPYNRLNFTPGPHGIGSTASNVCSLPAIVSFSDHSGKMYRYKLTVDVSDPKQINQQAPCLLGRSILHKWKMRYDHPSNVLEIEA